MDTVGKCEVPIECKIQAGNYIRGDVQLPQRRHLDIGVNSAITESHIWSYTPYFGLIPLLSSTKHCTFVGLEGRWKK